MGRHQHLAAAVSTMPSLVAIRIVAVLKSSLSVHIFLFTNIHRFAICALLICIFIIITGVYLLTASSYCISSHSSILFERALRQSHPSTSLAKSPCHPITRIRVTTMISHLRITMLVEMCLLHVRICRLSTQTNPGSLRLHRREDQSRQIQVIGQEAHLGQHQLFHLHRQQWCKQHQLLHRRLKQHQLLHRHRRLNRHPFLQQQSPEDMHGMALRIWECLLQRGSHQPSWYLSPSMSPPHRQLDMDARVRGSTIDSD